MPREPDPRISARAGRGARAALIASALACAALALSGVFPVNNSDTFGHLAQGRQIAALGRVPTHDTLSFWKPEPQPWHNYEWLSDLIGYCLYDAGGPNALIALKCATIALGGALLCMLAFVRAGPRAAIACAVLLVLAIPASRFRFTERPHVVALPLSALYLIGLAFLLRGWGAARPRVDAAIVLGLACAHALWVNLHGSHLLGLALTVIHLGTALAMRDDVARGARRKLAAVLGLQLLASCLSPYGPAIVSDAVEHMLDPQYRELVTEWVPWQAKDPLLLLLAPLVQSLLLVLALRALFRGGPASRALLLCSVLLALAAFRSLRFVAEYLLISAPALAVALAPRFEAIAFRRFIAVAGFAGALAAAGAAMAAPRLPPYAGIAIGTSDLGLPAASGHWLAHRARAPRVLAAVEDSWYLMFAAPNARFLVDGRVPFYGAEHIQQVRLAIADARRLVALLERYRVDTVVVRHTFEPHRVMLATLRRLPSWAVVAIEDRYAIFARHDLALQDGGRPEPLALEPGYELPWLQTADAARERAILRELDKLPAHENARGYAAWVRAVLALKPLLRRDGHDGLRAPANAAERRLLERAQRWLERASRGAEGVPIVHAYHALVAVARCDLEAAERALESARWEGESRETLLGAQEVALARGQRDAVSAFLAQAAALPQAEDDPWLAALHAGLRGPPRCPQP